MDILYFSMVIVFVTYVIVTFTIYGFLPSISDSYYKLPEKWNFLFALALWGFAIPAMIISASITPLMFIATASICFVGAASAFKSKIGVTKKVHEYGATTGIISSQIAIATTFGMWWLTAICITLSALLFYYKNSKLIKKKHISYIEFISFGAIVFVLGKYLFL